MTDTAFSLIAVFIAFFLGTQLWLITQVRHIVSTLDHMSRGQGSKRNLSQFHPAGEGFIPRINVRVESGLKGTLDNDGTKHPVQFRDVSETGALLYCEGDFSVTMGNSYGLKFSLPDGTLCETNARVVRETTEPGAYGVCFEGLPVGTKILLKKYINEQARKELTINPKIEAIR